MLGTVRRGDIYYADLSPVVGSEQGGMRPVLIVQNDIGNRYSPTVIAAAITSQTGKARLSYADSILRSWNRSGVRTIADVEKLDQAHELTVSQAQASAQTAAGKYAGGGFAGRFLNFEPSGTDWNAVADSVMRAQEEQERVPQES